jgi:hypothetical protein
MDTASKSTVQADGVPIARVPTVSHSSVMVRSNAMVVLALIAVVVCLHWAQAVFIPIVLSVFLSYEEGRYIVADEVPVAFVGGPALSEFWLSAIGTP